MNNLIKKIQNDILLIHLNIISKFSIITCILIIITMRNIPPIANIIHIRHIKIIINSNTYRIVIFLEDYEFPIGSLRNYVQKFSIIICILIIITVTNIPPQ